MRYDDLIELYEPLQINNKLRETLDALFETPGAYQDWLERINQPLTGYDRKICHNLNAAFDMLPCIGQEMKMKVIDNIYYPIEFVGSIPEEIDFIVGEARFITVDIHKTTKALPIPEYGENLVLLHNDVPREFSYMG